MRTKFFVSTFLLYSIFLTSFAPFVITANAQTIKGRPTKPRANMNIIPGNGLEFRLSEGNPEAEKRTVNQPTNAENLGEAETNSVLKRLPEIKKEADDAKEFAKRLGTLAAPKTGKTVPVKFPQSKQQNLANVDQSKLSLEVVRFAPEGEMSVVSDLSITFSQPMIALSSQEEAAQNVPVQLSPQVKGKWRWLGTRTLIFDAETRFQKATKFTATVPAGTKAINGQTLPKAVSWTFSTPPPKIEQMIPANQTTDRNPLMFVSFDQEINPAAVLQKIKVTAGGKPLPIRLATEAEIAQDGNASYYSKQVMPKRWLAFRAVNADGSTANALPGDSVITVTIEAGTPSAEGPLTTTKPQSFSFRTYGAMKFVKAYCSWEGNKTCSPFDQWTFQFTNPINVAKFKKEMVTIEPKVEGLKIFPSSNYLVIQGYKKGRTTYKVTVDGALTDIYSQVLEKQASATFTVGSAPSSFSTQGGNMIVLDPTAKPAFSVYTINHKDFKVQIRAVTPQDWEAFRQYKKFEYYEEGKRPALPGRIVFDGLQTVQSKPDELLETRIDLSKALDDGFGHAIITVEPNMPKTANRYDYNNRKVVVWVQATQIGLDALVDNEQLVAFATALKDGKPLADVELRIYPTDGSPLSKDEGGRMKDESFLGWAMSFFVSPTTAEDSEAKIEENPETSENATNAENAIDATNATNAENAIDAINAINATNAENAINAINTTNATNAQKAPNTTNAQGILRLNLPPAQTANKANVLIAKRGKDTAFLPESSDYFYQDQGSWHRREDADFLRWFVFDDRKMYRPKEEVAIKGYIRVIKGGKFGDVAELGDKAGPVSYIVRDSRGNEFAKGTANLNAFGAFDFKFKLPDNINLGDASIQLSTSSGRNGSQHYHGFNVQEFRRPEFEVSTSVETPAPHFVGSSATAAVEAKYYAGGFLTNAEANWTVTAQPANYTPPNRGDFTFGKWIPWWRSYDEDYGNRSTQYFKGTTGADGKHRLKLDFISANPPRPYSIGATASVMDVNRQTWTSSTSLLVHPSELYVGIRTPRTFVNKGETFTVETITTDIDGKAIAGRDVTVKAELKDWVYDNGWQQKTVDEQTCEIKSGEKAVECKFTAKAGGIYTLTASTFDDKERANSSELTLWVSGGKVLPKRNVEEEEVILIPNKKDYAPGETAEILVQTPFVPAEGVLTLGRDGILKTERFTLNEPSKVLKINIEERFLPNLYAKVDLVGASPRTNEQGEIQEKLAKRPAFASGNLNLPISLASRKLEVKAEPLAKNIEPGGETSVNVEVKDNKGNAVGNSEVAVVVVDESVLALSGYRVGNPLDTFYAQRDLGVTKYNSRKDVLLGNLSDVKPQEQVERTSGNMPLPAAAISASASRDMEGSVAPMESMALSKKKSAGEEAREKGSESNEAIKLRENFNALAVFAPNVKTDSSGKATVKVKLPDNLTRYRITAVSVDSGKRFGAGESSLTARQPLMVRPSAPRFLNFGDKFELPVVVQNQTDSAMTVNVAVRASNVELAGGGGRKVVVPANNRVEVRFPVTTAKAGTARFQIAVSSGKFADAAEISLPVWTPATTEAFAAYGTVDDNTAIVQPVQAPADVFSQFGGLEVTTSSTQLQELTDAYIYLSTYPFECTEQIASRMLATAALRDVLTAFKAKDMPSPEALKTQFANDMKKLQSRQRNDGSFGLWRRDDDVRYPYYTVHVAHALARAKAKGYAVPDEMWRNTLNYLKNIESHIPGRYSKESRWAIIAYALYVRNLTGDKDVAKAKALLTTATIDKLPLESLAWILGIIGKDANSAAQAEAIRRNFNNRATETAGAAHFVTKYEDGAEVLLHSDRRADGIILEALIADQPNNDLIPKIVRGLLANRTAGRWRNTQENVFILLALDKYFNTYEKVTPNFAAQIWLGNAYAGEQKFVGRSTDFNLLEIPMNYLMEQGGASNLIVNRTGEGRLYYRLGMKYAPKNLKLAPADYGFEVVRTYEAVDNKEDVKRNADGTWTIKAGARVRVRITMTAPTRRYHVALVDPLPAGLEIINPDLAVSKEPMPPSDDTGVVEYGASGYGRGWYSWRAVWYEHQNLRDERAEAFASVLWQGAWNYSYVARATTPGTFVVPPAKAEEMYMPETFGRSGTDFVKVE